ncbi:hypothetical protein OS493_036513 [Desmophyllum pertusum]|uniref:Uncharacterized protein n=1 Tax=Desmophyllum pertusum TaxID=174260 RepID=A0A9W9ZZ46_9CNID|nr:hypothetical protein OS493_036513 [Desmophyllum pertusum]
MCCSEIYEEIEALQKEWKHLPEKTSESTTKKMKDAGLELDEKEKECEDIIIKQWKEQVEDNLEGPIHLVMSTGQVVGPNTTPEQWFKECLKAPCSVLKTEKNSSAVHYVPKGLGSIQRDNGQYKSGEHLTCFIMLGYVFGVFNIFNVKPQEDDGDGNDDDDDKIKVRLKQLNATEQDIIKEDSLTGNLHMNR